MDSFANKASDVSHFISSYRDQIHLKRCTQAVLSSLLAAHLDSNKKSDNLMVCSNMFHCLICWMIFLARPAPVTDRMAQTDKQTAYAECDSNSRHDLNSNPEMRQYIPFSSTMICLHYLMKKDAETARLLLDGGKFVAVINLFDVPALYESTG